jgi:hypothetical protein
MPTNDSRTAFASPGAVRAGPTRIGAKTAVILNLLLYSPYVFRVALIR